MDSQYMQEMFANRIGGSQFGIETTLFKFEKIKQAKRDAVRNNPDTELIDLGVGEPDEMADENIVKKLCEQAALWENRGYADNGIPEFKKAAAEYLGRVYQVSNLDYETQILPSIGSKAALSMIPQAFINPGDITLMTVPGYPIIGTKTDWLGGEVYPLPLLEENDFLPELEKIPEYILNRAKLLYINYPNNPTGSTATRSFYEKVVEFAEKNHIIVIQDAAYAAITFHGNKPLSFLSVPGAMEVGVEVHSLSKAFNMTGWRLGFVAGNPQIIKAIAAVKDNNDSGQFKAVQHAGVYAMQHPQITENINQKYERRHHKLAKVWREAGFSVRIPDATFYEYVNIPSGTQDGVSFKTAEQFSDYLIRNALISTVPWEDAGNYVRLSVTYIANSQDLEDTIMEEIGRRLKKCRFVFQ